MAVRQALRLCEAEMPERTLNGADPRSRENARHGQPYVSVVTARTALRAAGLPPHLAAELRSRLRLAPEPEARS